MSCICASTQIQGRGTQIQGRGTQIQGRGTLQGRGAGNKTRKTVPYRYSHATRLDHAKLCWIIQRSTKESLLKVTVFPSLFFRVLPIEFELCLLCTYWGNHPGKYSVIPRDLINT